MGSFLSHPLQNNLAVADKIWESGYNINLLEDGEPEGKKLRVYDLYLKTMQNQVVVEAFIKGSHFDLSLISIGYNIIMKGPFAREIITRYSFYFVTNEISKSGWKSSSTDMF